MEKSRVNSLLALALIFILSVFGGASSASAQSDYVLYDDFEDGVVNLNLWAPWGPYSEGNGKVVLGADGSIQTTPKLIGMSASLRGYQNVSEVGDNVNVHLMTVTPTGDVVAVAEYINIVAPLNPGDPPMIVSNVGCVWYEGGITYPSYVHHIDLEPAQWDQAYVFGLEYTAYDSILVLVNETVVHSFPDIPGAADAYFQGGAVFKIQVGSPGGGDVRAEIDWAKAIAASGAIQFSSGTYSVDENGGSATITVTRAGGSSGVVGVSYVTSDGTATAGSDYTFTSGTLIWANGDAASKTFSITILDDSAYEGTETVNLTLSNPTGGAILGSPNTAVLNIIDNDPAPGGSLQFSSATYSVDENGGSATITVTRAGGSSGAVGVSYATSDGTAIAGSDYTSKNGNLIWADNDTASKTFSVPILDDSEYEGTETVNLILSNPMGGATLGSPNTAVLNIIDNDPAPPAAAGTLQFSSATYNVDENGGSATITVTRAGGSSGVVGVSYVTSDGAATAGSDYASTSGTLIWTDGDTTSKTFIVPILDDSGYEGAETVNLTLSSPTGGAILGSPNTALLNIIDNDFTIDPTYAWHTFYGVSGGNVEGRGITTDGSGNVYVTGTSNGTWNGPAGQNPLNEYSGGYYNVFVLKLSSSGAYQWHTFYGSGSDDGIGIATDGSGGVYVTGVSGGGAWNGPTGQNPLNASSGYVDIFVLKLDSSGAYQWHTFYGSSDSDTSYDIATDGSGNVYVTGESALSWNGPTGQNPLHTSSGDDDIFVLKLSSNGSYQWHTFYGSYVPGSGECGYGIATDGSGNVYVSGSSPATWNGPAGESPLHAFNGGGGIFVLKLASSGAYQWHTFYGVADGIGIATDRSGNVYVTGYGWATWNGPAGESPLHAHSGGGDFCVLKLANSGAYQWHTFYGSSDWDMSYDVAADGGGNVYVTGYSDATWNGPAGQSPLHAFNGTPDIFVLKLASSGSYQWHTFYGSSVTDYGYRIATDGSGNVYATGSSSATWNGPAGESPLNGFIGINDIFVLKLSDTPSSCDFDGDGKSDIAVWRQSDGYWYIVNSKDGGVTSRQWGAPYAPYNDVAVPGDYDGDGKTDIAVWRQSDGYWYIVNSKDGGVTSRQWGAPYAPYNDVAVPGDYDGDGKTDIAIWRQADGYWYIVNSKDGSIRSQQWGAGYAPYNDVPVPGDYDGDGKTDCAVWRPGDGFWYILKSSDGGVISQQWGSSALNDVLVPGDYDGDGKTDIAVWRPAEGYWYIISSKDGSIISQQWGAGYAPYNDVPVPGDYDGDGITDFAVWRVMDGYWHILKSSDGGVISQQWGWGLDPINDEPISQRLVW